MEQEALVKDTINLLLQVQVVLLDLIMQALVVQGALAVLLGTQVHLDQQAAMDLEHLLVIPQLHQQMDQVVVLEEHLVNQYKV